MNPTCSCGKSPARIANNSPLVLVVDEEPLVRWSLTAGLQAAGCDAVAAADGAEALRLARGLRPPDVVLLDVRLWGTDLERLVRDLRDAAPQCRLLILAVTGQDGCGAFVADADVIRKPFDLHDVIRVVRSTACPEHRMRPAV